LATGLRFQGDDMDLRRVMAVGVVAVLAVAVGSGSEAAAQRKKAKGQRAGATSGAAGAVSSPRASTFTPRDIDGDAFQGVFCTGTTPNVHQLGTLPAGTGAIIDFDSDDNSDPIAILTTLKTDGTDIGAENQGSDDEGGNLNPRFELRRPYRATYVLTVATADEDQACYAFRMRVRP
jgi:hypothetical protein